MYRYELKRIIASILIICILGLNIIPLLSYITQARDPDFQKAIVWAKSQGYIYADHAASYPFFPLQRKEASVRFAQYASGTQQACIYEPILNPRCDLKDTTTLSTGEQAYIRTACQCQYLMGNGGNFEPSSYLSKASSIVALLRGIYGTEAYTGQSGQKYRDPYVKDAYQRGITKSAHIEYLQYIVTNYEFVLMLWRADQGRISH